VDVQSAVAVPVSSPPPPVSTAGALFSAPGLGVVYAKKSALELFVSTQSG